MTDRKLTDSTGSSPRALGDGTQHDTRRLAGPAEGSPAQAGAGSQRLGGSGATSSGIGHTNTAGNNAGAPDKAGSKDAVIQKRLPVSGMAKVNLFRAAVALVAATAGALYYGDESKEKVRVISKGDTPAVLATAEQYRTQPGAATAEERLAKLNALKGTPLKEGSIGSGTHKPSASEARTNAVTQAIAGDAREPSMESLTNGKRVTESPGLYASALAVKATHNNTIMGAGFALGLLGSATLALRFLSSKLVGRRKTMPNGASIKDGVGITSTLYGYDTKEKHYMAGVKEGAAFELGTTKKDFATARETPPTDMMNTIGVRQRLAEIQPRIFPLFRPSQVEQTAGRTSKGDPYYEYEPKPGTTNAERLGVTAPELPKSTAATQAAAQAKAGQKPPSP